MKAAACVAGLCGLLAALAACQGAHLMEAIYSLQPSMITYPGTWANAAYNPKGGKVVLTQKSMAVFDRDTDPTPSGTFTLDLAVAWDGDYGSRCFKVTVSRLPASSAYYLMRVSEDERTLEIVYTTSVYPVLMSSSDPTYRVFTRQGQEP